MSTHDSIFDYISLWKRVIILCSPNVSVEALSATLIDLFYPEILPTVTSEPTRILEILRDKGTTPPLGTFPMSILDVDMGSRCLFTSLGTYKASESNASSLNLMPIILVRFGFKPEDMEDILQGSGLLKVNIVEGKDFFIFRHSMLTLPDLSASVIRNSGLQLIYGFGMTQGIASSLQSVRIPFLRISDEDRMEVSEEIFNLFGTYVNVLLTDRVIPTRYLRNVSSVYFIGSDLEENLVVRILGKISGDETYVYFIDENPFKEISGRYEYFMSLMNKATPMLIEQG